MGATEMLSCLPILAGELSSLPRDPPCVRSKWMSFAELVGYSHRYGFNAREKRKSKCKLSVDELDKRGPVCCRDMGVCRDPLECPNSSRREQGLERMFYQRVKQIEQLETLDQFEGVIPKAVLEAEPKRGTNPLIVVLDVKLRKQVITHEGMEFRELGTWTRKARFDRLLDDCLLISAESGFNKLLRKFWEQRERD